MKKIIIIFFIINSCIFIDEKNVAADNLISEDKMIEILYDMSLISVSRGINKRIIENNGLKPKKYILKKHNIDSIQFVASNEYYSKDLETYLSIYEEVLKKLQSNREIVIDTIESKKEERARRSEEIILETPKNNKLSKPNLDND